MYRIVLADDEKWALYGLSRLINWADYHCEIVGMVNDGISALELCRREKPDLLILDEPTNHLDLESITALNKGMIEFTGSMLFATQDHECIQTVANRIMELLPGGLVDRRESYDDYLDSEIAKQQREALMQA